MKGIAGKNLRINLSSREVYVEDNTKDLRKWLGGYGLAGKIIFEEMPEWVTPFDARNRIIISAGVLIGTMAPGACKLNVSTLSPVTGGWASGFADSHLGMEIKQCGFDNIIIEGRSSLPCYLWITDDKVEIRDAVHIWGKNTWETYDAIRTELGDNQLHVMSIGPAGENLVRGACVIQDRDRAFGRCGVGAVFGSKNLKAVVARGTKPIEIADPQRFFKIVQLIHKNIMESPTRPGRQKYGTTNAYYHKQKVGIPFKNFQECQLDEDLVEQISPHRLIEKYQVGTVGYPSCMMRCGREIHITEGPYAGLRSQMNQLEVIGTFMGRLAIRTREFMVAVSAKCNQVGIDVDAAGGAVGWAMECWQRGIIDEKDTDGINLDWGNEKATLELIDKISHREGFGNILAEGSARASEILGRNSGYYAMHIKKQDLYEVCRSSNGWALGAAVSTKGGGHVSASPLTEQTATPSPDADCLREYGMSSAQAADPHDYELRPQLVNVMEIICRIGNSCGVCLYHTTWNDPNLLNLPRFAELISAALGEEFTAEELKEIALRQLNMEKAINCKFTNLSRKDDFPPQREMEEPVSRGYYKGWKLDEGKWNHMLDKYYDLHGWDKRTSYPTRETLTSLGLANVADELERIGHLGAAE
jgi:aldehyde:ferredoxin oxidoreductase